MLSIGTECRWGMISLLLSGTAKSANELVVVAVAVVLVVTAHARFKMLIV
jgi:hypothetical protein